VGCGGQVRPVAMQAAQTPPFQSGNQPWQMEHWPELRQRCRHKEVIRVGTMGFLSG
jgi:hypothetical protein